MATYEEMMMAASQRAAAAAAAASAARSEMLQAEIDALFSGGVDPTPQATPEELQGYERGVEAISEIPETEAARDVFLTPAKDPLEKPYDPLYFSTLQTFDEKMAYLKATNPDAYAELHDTGFGGQWDKDINGNTLPASTNYREVLENRLNNWDLATNAGARPDALTYDEFTEQQTADYLQPANLIDPLGGTEDVIDLGTSIVEGDIPGALEAGTDIAAPGLLPTVGFAEDVAAGVPVNEALADAGSDFVPGAQAYGEMLDQAGQQMGDIPDAIAGTQPPALPGSEGAAAGAGTPPPIWGPGAIGSLPEINRDDFVVQRIDQPWLSPELGGLGVDLRTRVDTFTPDVAPTVTEDQALIDAYAGSRGTQVSDIDRIRDAAAQQEAMAAYMASQRGMYQDAAMGRVPSVAELQMNAGLQQALRSQLAAARTQRNAGAFYTAGQVGDQLQAQTIQQQAILRAQEQEAARKAYADYMAQEAQALGMATEGRTSVATQQGALTQQDITRMAQGIDVSKANVDAEIRTRAGNNEMLINYYNQMIEAEKARLDALKSAAAENATVAAGSQEFAKTKAQADTTKYSTDVQAGSSKYSTDVTKQIEDEKAKVLRDAAEMGALGTLGAGVGSALG